MSNAKEQGTGNREQEKLARVRECLINCVYAEGRLCPDDCPMKDDEWKANGKAACRAYFKFNVEVPLSLLEDAIDLLKAQEPPTSEFISSAIECLLHPQDADDSDMAKAIDTAVRAMRLLNAQEPQWIPITFRELTEEEKTEHPDWCSIIDSPTPDDGEDILVSDGKTVWADVWSNDGEWCALESGLELEGVAWQKMPSPWKNGGADGDRGLFERRQSG